MPGAAGGVCPHHCASSIGMGASGPTGVAAGDYSGRKPLAMAQWGRGDDVAVH